MPQSLANVLVHIVFSTLDRQRFLRADRRTEMHRYLAGVSAKLGCLVIVAGGTEDHVHILARQARTIALADWVKELKRVSSVWAKDWEPRFQWQAGYGAFSVSQSLSLQVQRYVEQQLEHHRRFDFQDELRRLLARHRVAFDERYIWD